VVSADTVDAFKICLDSFWIDQEIKYNWKADIRIIYYYYYYYQIMLLSKFIK